MRGGGRRSARTGAGALLVGGAMQITNSENVENLKHERVAYFENRIGVTRLKNLWLGETING